jgi:hypothetical protein
MTPDRWKDVERLYHAAQAEAPEARPAFLAKACGGDEKLQQEVQSLLGHAAGTGVLDRIHDQVSERRNDPTRTRARSYGSRAASRRHEAAPARSLVRRSPRDRFSPAGIRSNGVWVRAAWEPCTRFWIPSAPIVQRL